MRKQLTILAFVLLSLSCSTFAKPTKIEYLMPEGFTGGVLVLYNQPDGTAPEVLKDGTTRYRIPKDGFLKVNTPEPDAIYNYSFYYVDDKNNVTRIEYILPHGSPASETVNQRSVDTITDEERNTKVFVMNHRGIGFKIHGQEVPLYAFSVGLPKNSTDIYVDIDFRVGDIREELSKKRP